MSLSCCLGPFECDMTVSVYLYVCVCGREFLCVFVLSKLLVASRMTHELSPLSCPFEYLLPILNPYKYASVPVCVWEYVCLSVCDAVIMKS